MNFSSQNEHFKCGFVFRNNNLKLNAKPFNGNIVFSSQTSRMPSSTQFICIVLELLSLAVKAKKISIIELSCHVEKSLTQANLLQNGLDPVRWARRYLQIVTDRSPP